MSIEKVLIAFEAVGLKEMQANLRKTIKLVKQLSREQKKAKIKVKVK